MKIKSFFEHELIIRHFSWLFSETSDVYLSFAVLIFFFCLACLSVYFFILFFILYIPEIKNGILILKSRSSPEVFLNISQNLQESTCVRDSGAGVLR